MPGRLSNCFRKLAYEFLSCPFVGSSLFSVELKLRQPKFTGGKIEQGEQLGGGTVTAHLGLDLFVGKYLSWRMPPRAVWPEPCTEGHEENEAR
jgi:hypothetical protein